MSAETLVRVSDDDVYNAYLHFKEVFYPDVSLFDMCFWRFINCVETPDRGHSLEYWELPERAAHYVNLLKGPHYRAIAKAMVINGHQYKERLK